MVRVLAVADEVVPRLQETGLTHAGGLDPRPDVVLAAGDLPWDYLEALAANIGVPTVFVPGNHDPAIGSRPAPRGVVNADDRVVLAGGLRIAGLGGCVRYNDGPHQYTQRQYARRVRRLSRRARRGGGIDVLLTHAPPRGLGDQDDPSHVGVEALHDLLRDLTPRFHVHGHIHPYGFPKPDRHVGATTITNVVPWRLLEV